jgi:hypothetical protein
MLMLAKAMHETAKAINPDASHVEILFTTLISLPPNDKLTHDEERAKGDLSGTKASARSSSFGRASCWAWCHLVSS